MSTLHYPTNQQMQTLVVNSLKTTEEYQCDCSQCRKDPLTCESNCSRYVPMKAHWNFQKKGDGKLTVNEPESVDFDTDGVPPMPRWEFPKPKK